MIGNSSSALTTPMRAYSRLAMIKAASSATTLEMPEKSPRNPASSASLLKVAETALPKGKLTAK